MPKHPPQPLKLLIEVSGGTVQAVYADAPSLVSVSICDHDNECSDGGEWREEYPVQWLEEFESNEHQTNLRGKNA